MDTCSTCGQEIRFGIRNPTPQWPGLRWLHRDPATDADHIPTHGKLLGREGWEKIAANKDAMVAARDGKKDSRFEEEDDDDEEDQEEIVELPEPEMRSTPIPITDLAPRSGMRQIANLIEKTDGWTLRTLTKARGPYVGARGQVLSISDATLIRAVGEEVDGVRPFAVASWRDGKFDFAYIGTLKAGVVRSEPANATDLKNWIKTA